MRRDFGDQNSIELCLPAWFPTPLAKMSRAPKGVLQLQKANTQGPSLLLCRLDCLRSDRGVCARGYAPGTKGQRLAKRCLHPFSGMRRVCAGYKKFHRPLCWIPGLAWGSRQQNRSKEPKLLQRRGADQEPPYRRKKPISGYAPGVCAVYIYIYICEKLTFYLNFLGVCAKVCVSIKSKIPKTCYGSPIRFPNAEVSARLHEIS